MNRHRTRSGTVLLIVVGLSGLLASVAVAFLVRVQQGDGASVQVANETQARLMLHAACAYVLEAARLGYGQDRLQAVKAPGSRQGFVQGPDGRLMHREGYGWIDVRDSDGTSFPDPALPGPRDQNGRVVYQPGIWPAVGGVVICPMHRWMRPPYAITPRIAANPIQVDDERRGDQRWGRPLLLNPDPQPLVGNGWPQPVKADQWEAFVRGDPSPVAESVGKAWFRIRRTGAATFLVTCGAGGSWGFRDWDEVKRWDRICGAPDGEALFQGDRRLFDALCSHEVRMWYEIRWSAAVRPLDFRHEEALWWGMGLQNAFAYRIYPVNGTQYPGWCRANRCNPNPLGTISYIQRLDSDGMSPRGTDGRPIREW